MEEDDFNDPEENKNEFKTPTFTSEWLENEKYTFKKIRDKNGDGYLGLVLKYCNFLIHMKNIKSYVPS